MRSYCALCATATAPVADLGPQPVTCRYRRAGETAPEARFPLALGQCPACGLLQLTPPAPAAELKPPFPWVSYRDPDAHLDGLAAALAPRLPAHARVVGVGPASRPLLERLGRPAKHLGAAELAAAPAGSADLVVALHILEHAQDLKGFLAGLRRLLAPGGLAVVEVPDSARPLEALDVSVLWEDHALYFTRATFAATLAAGGLAPESVTAHPYALEDSLVAVCRASEPAAPPAAAAAERERAEAFARGWRGRGDEFRKIAASAGGPTAVFGAGHRAGVFVNAHGLGPALAFCVDDDANKRGLRLPGSGLPIEPSSALLDRGARLCLLAVSPESEDKVMEKNRAWTAAGGRFVSIYPGSRVAAGAKA